MITVSWPLVVFAMDAAKIQLGMGQELQPAPAINQGLLLAGLVSQHVQPKKDFSCILGCGDAKGPGGPFCS